MKPLHRLHEHGFDFNRLPVDLRKNISIDESAEYNEKRELLDVTVFEAIKKLFPLDTAVKKTAREYAEAEAKIVNDGFNTDLDASPDVQENKLIYGLTSNYQNHPQIKILSQLPEATRENFIHAFYANSEVPAVLARQNKVFVSYQLKMMPLAEIIPSQSGIEYENASSENEAEDYKRVMNNDYDESTIHIIDNADEDSDLADVWDQTFTKLNRNKVWQKPPLRVLDYMPIVMDASNNKIIDGNHKHYALTHSGNKEALVMIVETKKKSITAEEMLQLPETKARIEQTGFDEKTLSYYLAKTKSYKPDTYYHIHSGTGEAGVGNGLYLGRDVKALKRFYDVEKQNFKVSEYHGTPKFWDLMLYADFNKAQDEAVKRYKVKLSSDPIRNLMQRGEAIKKLALENGYDGIRYYDPDATGEEFVVYKMGALNQIKEKGGHVTNDYIAPEGTEIYRGQKKGSKGNYYSLDKSIAIGYGELSGSGREIITKNISGKKFIPYNDILKRHEAELRKLYPEIFVDADDNLNADLKSDYENDKVFLSNYISEFLNQKGYDGVYGENNKEIILFADGGTVTPATKSNLTPAQQALVRTPAFKAWFGDSKVVDENGEPYVCYHGSSNDFTTFRNDVGHANDRGFYGEGYYFTFGNGKYSKGEAGYYGNIVKEFFIKAINPFDISALSEYEGHGMHYMGYQGYAFLANVAIQFPELANTIFINKKGKFDEEEQTWEVDKVPISVLPGLMQKYKKELKIRTSKDNSDQPVKTGYVKSEIVEYDYSAKGGAKGSYERFDDLGSYRIQINDDGAQYPSDTAIEFFLIVDAIEKHDGISVDFHPEGLMTRNPEITEAIKNHGHDAIMQSKQGDEIVVFSPSQIKLADGSNTTFDATNDDIRFAEGGIIESSKFKKWFKGSKIVDAGGKPLVMWHGTTKKFTVFDFEKLSGKFSNNQLGFFFEAAKSGADFYTGRWGKSSPYYLNIKKPKIFMDVDFIKHYQADYEEMEALKEKLLKEKYDGIIYLGNDDVSIDMCVAFSPSQIKLADGSNTTFDASNDDIRFAKGGIIKNSRSGEPIMVYHGTPDNRFSVTKNSLMGQYSDELSTGDKGVVWFTDNRNVAKSYADPHRAFDYQNSEPAVLERYITMQNPLELDAYGALWRKLPFVFDGKEVKGTRELVDYAKEKGHDGIIIRNVHDNYNHFKGEDLNKKYLGTNYAVFSDEQILTKPEFAEGGSIPDYDYHLEKLISNYGDEDSAKEALDWYDKLLTKINKNGGKVYRIVFVKNESKVNKKLGKHWTLQLDAISSLYENIDLEDEELKPYLITGFAKPGSVDFKESIASYSQLPDEMEINFKTQPDVVSIKRYHPKFAKGGKANNEITCKNCGWSWSITDSHEHDKHICHKCNFDNNSYAKGGKLYHGTDNPNMVLTEIKTENGYHPGAGAVEFLGISLTDSKKIAKSYGKHVREINFSPQNPKRFRSLEALRNTIYKTFAPPVSGKSTVEYYRETGENFRIKLQSEGYDAVIFPEGMKHNNSDAIANTIIPLVPITFVSDFANGGKIATKLMYHGTSAPDFAEFKSDVVYLTPDIEEAEIFALNPIAGGGRGTAAPRMLHIQAPGGKVKDINDIVEDAIMESQTSADLDTVINVQAELARKEGYEYLLFNHPSSVGNLDFEAYISLHPEKLKIVKSENIKFAGGGTTDAWNPKFQVGDKVRYYAPTGEMPTETLTVSKIFAPAKNDTSDGYSYMFRNSGLVASEKYLMDASEEPLSAINEPETTNPKPFNTIADSVAKDQSKSISQRVEERLRDKQKNKEFKDTQRRVGGTRKEMAAFRNISQLSYADLAKAEEGNMGFELVKKDKVWLPYNVQTLRDAGVTSGAAFLIKKLRETFPSKPKNDSAARKMYIGVANALAMHMAEVKSVRQFKQKTKVVELRFAYYALSALLDPSEEKLTAWEAEMWDTEAQKSISVSTWQHDKEEFENFILKMQEKYGQDYDYYSFDENDKKEFDFLKDLKSLSFQVSESNEKFQHFPQSLWDALIIQAKQQGKEKLFNEGVINYPNSLVKDYFGVTFYNFLFNRSDASQDSYDKAEYDYDEITPERSEETVQDKAKYTIRDVVNYKEKIALYKKPEDDPARFEELFNTESWCYNGIDVPRKFGSCWTPKHADETSPLIIGRLKNQYLEFVIKIIERKLPEMTAKVKAIRERYKPHPEDWTWAFPTASDVTLSAVEGQKPETEKIQVHGAKPLDFIRRKGGLKITDADVTVDNIQTLFGFKAVELGQYMEDSFARESIRHFLGAMADLGEILNMDLITLNSLNKYNQHTGGLSMWFGAAGYGRAMAYFSANKVVINLTKSKGQGTIAHEYGHYLDMCMAYMGNPGYKLENGGDNFGTDQYIESKNSYYGDSYNSNVVRAKGVQQKLFDLQLYINSLRYPDYLKAEGKYEAPEESEKQSHIDMPISNNAGAKTFSGSWLTFLSRQTDETDEQFMNRVITVSGIKYDANSGITNRELDVLKYVMRKYNIASVTVKVPIKNNATKFAIFSRRQGKYWRTPTEMFARAMETYIFSKLELAGRENNYLVSDRMFNYPVYPQGTERKNIFYLFDELFKAFKSDYNVPDFKPFTTERVTEVLELKDEKTEKIKKGIVVDAESGEVEELMGASSKIHEQFVLLNHILMEELHVSYELGGSVGENFNEIVSFVSENK